MKKLIFTFFFFPLVTFLNAQSLSGTYYIGAAGTAPGGTNPTFSSLKAACDSINNSAITGNCTFYITSDVIEPYTGSVGIGLAVNPDPYTITFKPYTGVQPTITFNYPTDLNSGPSGAFVIGIPGKGNVTWDSLRITKNIVFDGSNTNGGTTRDLTLQSALTAQRNSMPIVIVGNVSNVVVKNCNIFYKAKGVSTSGNLFVSAVQIRSRNYLSTDWVPTNITLDNNHISANFDSVAQSAQAIGFYQSGTPLPSTFPNNIVIKNNLLEGKRRVISLYIAGSTTITNNELILNQDIAANTTNEAIYAANVMTGSVIAIQNNKFSKISSKTSGTGYGDAAINIESNGTYNVNNNMIYGFQLTAANPTAYLIGIRDTSSTSTLNCYFNSIYMNDISDIGTGTVAYKGILISKGTNDVKDNIVFSAETNFPNYCFSREGTAGTLTSDYNDFYTSDAINGNVGYWNNAATLTLANWKTASLLDANSLSVNPGFVSTTDLHLSSSSSPVVGKGTPIVSITSDIDGNPRSATPSIGADEVKSGLSGTYYIGAAGTAPGGTNPNFSSLSAATKMLDSAGVSGNVTFYFTSSLTETVNSTIGLNPAPFTVTFKPYTGTVDTVKFTQVADNTGASGGLVFGPPSLSVTSTTNYGLVTTENIIIDGSNTAGGTTRDLVFVTAAGINSNTSPLRILGDVNNVTIKNCKVVTLQSVSYAIAIVNRNGGATYGNWTPDSITITNCEVINTVGATAQGIAITNSGTPTTFPTSIVFSNNKVTAKTRGIFLNYAGNMDVFGNEISVIQTNTGYMSYGIWGLTIGDSTNVLNFYNNKIVMLSTANTASGDYGIVGIEAGSKGTYNIYNNMISGFVDSAATANPNCKLIGIRLQSASVNANVYFNSILMPDLSLTPGTGTVLYTGIYIASGNNIVKNNIVVTKEKDFPSYCFYRSGTTGTLVSDYNDLFASDTAGNVGFWNTAAAKNLAAWQTASAMDANSMSADPGFVSSSDLHLSLNSSPVVGKGTPISWITKDIDGDLRDTPPEIGADEKPGVIPVELTSFYANLVDNKVKVEWTTATETNNARFEIEKNVDNAGWIRIGAVAGQGTSTQSHNYSFVDPNADFAKASYRLKQVDLNGSFTYSKSIEVSSSAPVKFDLSQNYPNPFNPSTVIEYSLASNSQVKLEVYSITGQRIKVLVDEVQPAGVYHVKFNGSSLASGIYFYRITAGNFVVTKKMQLIK